MLKTSRLFFAILLIASSLGASAASAADIMPLSQIRKGMKGYGVTVFDGTKLEKFDVEILGVLRNIGPDQNMILARVDHPVVQRAGVIAGMSGSPIYIDGKVIGALAFGWQFAKEPVCGIQPIEDMLKIPTSGGSGANALASQPSSTMNGAEFLKAIATGKTEELFQKMMAGAARPQAMAALSGAKPIAVPLSLSSFAPETVTRFAPFLESMGFMAVPSGSTSGSGTQQSAKTAAFKPGDPVGAVLLSGDFSVAATGTVTYVDGDRVYAFGHPFLDMGEISFPMATSEIVDVLPSLASSFKFANTGPIVGALTQDRGVGIMGTMGAHSQMIPVQVSVEAGGVNKQYNVSVIKHSQLSPLILAMAADTVVANAQRAAGERTVILDSEIKVKGYPPIHLREGWAGAQARQAIPAYLALVSGYLISNEFHDAEIESVKLNVRHDDQLRIAHVSEAAVIPPPNGRISAGDTVKVRAVMKPFRGEDFVETFDVKIPDDQPVGPAYLLVGSGSVSNAVDFTIVPPDPHTLDQVVDVLRRLKSSNDLTVGLYSNGDGAVTSGVYLPNLPPSVRAVITDDTSNRPQALVRYSAGEKKVKTLPYVVDGMVKIDVDVRPAV